LLWASSFRLFPLGISYAPFFFFQVRPRRKLFRWAAFGGGAPFSLHTTDTAEAAGSSFLSGVRLFFFFFGYREFLLCCVSLPHYQNSFGTEKCDPFSPTTFPFFQKSGLSCCAATPCSIPLPNVAGQRRSPFFPPPRIFPPCFLRQAGFESASSFFY